MKTIEERAREAGVVCQYKSDYRYDKRSVEYGYTQGATEQKAIDIDKACKWFGEYLMDIGYPDDWYRDSKVLMSGEERFRRAMGEDL